MRTYGRITLENGSWRIDEVPPHVSIKLKALFRKIGRTQKPPYEVKATGDSSSDLLWFIQRYPMEMDLPTRERLERDVSTYQAERDAIEEMLANPRSAREFKINGELRPYQRQGVEMLLLRRSLLVGDDVGLGKTLIAIGAGTDPRTLPMLIVCQAHLPKQWAGAIVRFLGARVHVLKKSTPYALPPADVYITTYAKLAGWSDVLASGFFKMAVFDEIQELRIPDSQKYKAARRMRDAVDFCLGLSATPIYNYGDESFAIFDLISPGTLGSREAFLREWTDGGKVVRNPAALGSYLRDQQLFLRRTRKDVQRELPPVNKVIQAVEHRHKDEKEIMKLAKRLARTVTHGSFVQSGQAARELDVMIRLATGVGKARSVAQYVRIILENGLPVLLGGWHRAVYDIWLEELAEFKPVLYTGSESPSQKEATRRAFLSGETNLMIMSLRSGVGLDGLQARCQDVVLGELDWSPAVHRQFIGRVDRDGQEGSVTAHYLISDWGSDPVMVDLLGLKANQAEAIVDPFGTAQSSVSDDSRIKELARRFLKNQSQEEAQALEGSLV